MEKDHGQTRLLPGAHIPDPRPIPIGDAVHLVPSKAQQSQHTVTQDLYYRQGGVEDQRPMHVRDLVEGKEHGPYLGIVPLWAIDLEAHLQPIQDLCEE